MLFVRKSWVLKVVSQLLPLPCSTWHGPPLTAALSTIAQLSVIKMVDCIAVTHTVKLGVTAACKWLAVCRAMHAHGFKAC